MSEDVFATRLGERIKELRQNKRLTQEALAEKIEKTVGLIVKIERGEAKPSVESLVDIINALEATPNEVLCDMIKADTNTYNQAVLEMAKLDSESDRRYIVESIRRFRLHKANRDK